MPLFSDRFNLILILLLHFTVSVATQDANITIPLNNSITNDNREIYGAFITLNGVSNVKVEFSNINKNLSFIVFQAHSHINRISLYNQAKEYVNGTNVGLVSFKNKTDEFDIYHIENSNENFTVRVYISVHGYFEGDPIPGGCNMEFATTISPYLHTITGSDYILIDAAAPSIDPICSYPFNENLTFQFYLMYLPELNFLEDVYFDGIRKMMSLKNIMEYGKIIPKSSWPDTRRMMSVYPGTGSVYTVVATRNYEDKITYSVYVPNQSYGCSNVDDEGCELIFDWVSQLLCAALLFVGAFVCFFGHRFFKTEMFLAGFFSGVLITYILIALVTVINKPALLGGAVLSGIFFGAIWWLFWWLYGIPVLSVLLPSLKLGFLLAAIFYYSLPGHQLYLEIDFNFWSLFTLVVMLTAVAVVSVTYAANILCCAILGAYLTVLSIDYYLGSSLKYIVINVIRRAVVPRFNKAVLLPPLQWKDALVILMWVVLATLGFLFQHWHNRGRPPFPPPPRVVRPSMNEPILYGAIGQYMGRPERVSSERPVVSRMNTERTPLLA